MSKGADGRRPSCLTCEPTGTGAALRAVAGRLDDGCLVRPARCRVAVTGPSVGRCITCRGKPGAAFDRRELGVAGCVCRCRGSGRSPFRARRRRRSGAVQVLLLQTMSCGSRNAYEAHDHRGARCQRPEGDPPRDDPRVGREVSGSFAPSCSKSASVFMPGAAHQPTTRGGSWSSCARSRPRWSMPSGRRWNRCYRQRIVPIRWAVIDLGCRTGCASGAS